MAAWIRSLPGKMAVLDLATIITPLKFNFLHIVFIVNVILNLDANRFYLVTRFIYLYIIIIFVFISLFLYFFIYYLGIEFFIYS